MRDQLTGLANRRAWDERFVHELRKAARSGTPLSVAVIDLDGLKRVNDTCGHGEGDRLIERCASAWRHAVRETDFVARLGGDEFFVLLPDCPEPEAMEVGRRMLHAVPSDQRFSLGVARWDGVESGDALIARADRAMYDAKAAGGGRMALAGAPVLSSRSLA
jgi:diguanylate cyclase (GGDEF)-like protein